MKRVSSILSLLNLAIIVVLSGGILSGCKTKPPMIAKPVQTTWIIEAPLETLWKSSIEALVEKGAQIKILDKATSLIVVEEFFDSTAFSQYIAEPYGFYGGKAEINILFTQQKENTTQVNIKPALFGIGRSAFPIKVTSNGKLERDYYLLISGSIPKEKTYPWLEEVEPKKEKK